MVSPITSSESLLEPIRTSLSKSDRKKTTKLAICTIFGPRREIGFWIGNSQLSKPVHECLKNTVALIIKSYFSLKRGRYNIFFDMCSVNNKVVKNLSSFPKLL